MLEYDDVMNEQRRVVYKYRREILEGRDMSDIARDELEGVIERLVDEYTPGDDLEEWDLAELETQLRQIWPVGVEVGAMAPEAVDREKLNDALDDDAMDAYDEREEELGEELMRYLERSILLQVIDNRWREHLYDMDYLREGIHLRGFAQIDPLVAYKNEGFAMFEELMHSIWEEFSKLIFHVEVEIEPGAGRQASSPATAAARRNALDYSGGTPEAQPSALQRSGRRGGAAGRRRAPRRRAATATAPRPSGRDRGQGRARQTSAATTPAGAGRARSTRSATGPEGARASHPDLRRPRQAADPSGSSSGAFNERDLDAFVEALDPEVELHASGACARGGRRRGSGRRGRRAAFSRRSSLDELLRGRHRVRDGSARGADPAGLASGTRTARTPARTRWPGCSSCASTGSGAGARSRTGPRRSAAVRSTASASAYDPARSTYGASRSPVRREQREATEAWSGPLFDRFSSSAT